MALLPRAPAMAATYFGHHVIGGADVNFTITTNGTTGLLTANDIAFYSVSVTGADGGYAFSGTGASGAMVTGSSFFATPNSLDFMAEMSQLVPSLRPRPGRQQERRSGLRIAFNREVCGGECRAETDDVGRPDRRAGTVVPEYGTGRDVGRTRAFPAIVRRASSRASRTFCPTWRASPWSISAVTRASTVSR